MSLHRARARDRHPSMATAGSELHRLCRSGDLSAVRSQITESAVNVNTVAGLNGCTPLHEAAMAGRADMVMLLYEDCRDSLDINVRTQRGPASTPLHLASERGHVECVMALVECGAILDMVDRRCRTAKDVAIEHGRRQVTFTLSAAEVEQAVGRSDVKRIQELVPQMTTTSKLTPAVKQWRQQRLNLALRKACLSGNYKIVVLLIRAGANNFTECIQSHQRLNHIIAFLRLCQAAQEDDRDTIQLLLNWSDDDPSSSSSSSPSSPFFPPSASASTPVLDRGRPSPSQPHLQEYHQILMPLLDNGKLSVAEPLHVALRADHISTAGHILLKAAKHPSSGMVNWQDLGLEHVSSMWLKNLELLNLTFLSLSFNKLTLIPPEIANLRNLVKIQLANNRISFVPSELFQLAKIESIDLSYNSITSLPEALLGQPSPVLATLHISNNKLVSFPNYFSKTDSLLDLDLSHNCLPEVSENICNLSQLERLNLSSNPDIRFIPYQLGGLSQLKILSIEGLPFATNIPEACSEESTTASNSSQSMLEFVQKRFTTMLSVQHYEIVVIGFSGFQQTLDSLLGALKSADLSCSYLSYANTMQFLQLHDIFKLRNSLYVIVWDCSSEQEVNSLHRILRYLSIYTSNVPVIVAACWRSYLHSHSELAIEESISQSLWSDLSDTILLRHVVLLEGGQGSDEFSIHSFLKFVRTVSETTREVMYVPSSYVKCHETIQHELSKSFLHNNKPPLLNEWEFWEVLRAMSSHDLSSYRELKNLVTFLTMKGTILHIPCNKGGMQDYYVLNRQWLCNTLSNAVHHRTGSVGYGSVTAIVHHEGLIDLLSCSMLQEEQQLPNGLRFLLNRQGITLALSSERWLVPAMLANRPDPQVENFVEQFGVRRQYTFSLTPSTFWGRLISHLLINMERLVREVSLAPEADCRRDTLTNRRESLTSRGGGGGGGGGVIDWAYWRRGITCWQNARNLVYSIDAIPTRDEPFSEGLEICVPDTPAGCRTMHILTYLIDNLFKNWYPTVWRSVEVWVPCSYCVHKQVKDVPSISFCDCLLAVSKGVGVKCIHHEKIVSISKIVPDLIHEDVSKDQFFPPGSVTFNVHDKSTCVSPAPLETVFKGMYSGKIVAVKPFPHPVPSSKSSNLDVPPNLQAWHEFATLRHAMVHSNSPFVLQAIGMCPDPLCLIFPFAKFTSLDEVFQCETQRITHLVRMRMVYQLAVALEALHSCNIIHRNVCLANILVMSLSADDQVNIKLGGFSDACYGIFQGVGTGCYGVYPAPEMQLIYMSEYDERIDIFAFAFVAYEIITRRKLLSSLPLEMSCSLATRPTLSPIQSRAPHMVSIINRCWDPVASKRPFASDLVEHLRLPLHNVMRDGKLVDAQHECFAAAVKFTRAQNSLLSDVYVCHGYLSSDCKVTLSHISLPGLNFKNSISLPSEYVICLGCVGSELWVSFNGRRLRVYSTPTLTLLNEYKFTHHIVVIAVSPTSVYLGLENGVLQVYDVLDNTPNDPLHTSVVSPGQEFKTIEALEDCIVCATKTEIFRLHPDTLATESKWPISVGDNEIRCIVVCDFEDEEDDIIWVSLRWNGTIQVMWNGNLRFVIECSNIIKPVDRKVRVLTMKAVLDTVWVGLMSGQILVFSAREPKPTLLTHLSVHEEEARHLLLLQPSYTGPMSVMSASEMLHSMKHLSVESDKSASSSSSNRFGIPESVCLVSFGQGLSKPLAELGRETTSGAVVSGERSPLMYESGLYAVVLDGMSTMRTWDLELRSGRDPLPYMEDLDRDSLYDYPDFVPDYQNTNQFLRTDTWTAGTFESPVHVHITSPSSTLKSKRTSENTATETELAVLSSPTTTEPPPIPPRSPKKQPPGPPPGSARSQQRLPPSPLKLAPWLSSSSNHAPPSPPSPTSVVIKEPSISPPPLVEEDSDSEDVYYVASSVFSSLPPTTNGDAAMSPPPLPSTSTSLQAAPTASLTKDSKFHAALLHPVVNAPQIQDSCECEDGYDPYVRMGSILMPEKPSFLNKSPSSSESFDRESDDFVHPKDFISGPILPPKNGTPNGGKAASGKKKKSLRTGPKPKTLPKPSSLTKLELSPSAEPHPLTKSTPPIRSPSVEATPLSPGDSDTSLEKVTFCDSTACVIEYRVKPTTSEGGQGRPPSGHSSGSKKSRGSRKHS